MKNIIEIEHLCKSFGEIKAVQDLSFCVKEGELFAFLGVTVRESPPPSTFFADSWKRTAAA